MLDPNDNLLRRPAGPPGFGAELEEGLRERLVRHFNGFSKEVIEQQNGGLAVNEVEKAMREMADRMVRDDNVTGKKILILVSAQKVHNVNYFQSKIKKIKIMNIEHEHDSPVAVCASDASRSLTADHTHERPTALTVTHDGHNGQRTNKASATAARSLANASGRADVAR